MLTNKFDKFITLVESECEARNREFKEVEFSSMYIKDKENKVRLQLKVKDKRIFPQAATMTEEEFFKNLEIMGSIKKVKNAFFDLIVNKAKGGIIP